MRRAQGQIPEIPVVKAITRLRDVSVPHAGDAFYGMCESGKQWVAKRASAADVAAESIGWFVAEHLEVLTAQEVAVLPNAQGLCWLSGYIAGVAEWSAADISSIVNPSELGRMMVLDLLIGNEDRHARNLLIWPRESGPHVVAIDMAAARVGSPGMFSPARRHDISRLAAGIVSRVIRSGLDEGLHTLSTVDDNMVYQWCVAAGHAAGLRDERVEDMCDGLITRRDACPSLVCQFVEDLDAREAS